MHSENCLGTTTEANIHNHPYLCSCGFSQSVGSKIKVAPALVAWQTSADSGSSSIMFRYLRLQRFISFNYFSHVF